MLTGRLLCCSLSLKASVLLCVCATAELVPELQMQPWALLSPQPLGRARRWLSGAQRAAFNDVLTLVVCRTVMKVVPIALRSVPAGFVLFAWQCLQQQFKIWAMWIKPWSRLGTGIHKLSANLSSCAHSQRAASSSAGWFREAKLSFSSESASWATHFAVPISTTASSATAGPELEGQSWLQEMGPLGCSVSLGPGLDQPKGGTCFPRGKVSPLPLLLHAGDLGNLGFPRKSVIWGTFW